MIRYLKTEDQNLRRVYISNCQHIVKYANKEYSDQFFGELDVRVEDLSSVEFERLCILATYVEYSYRMKGWTPPDWVIEDKLCLKKPYFCKGYLTEWFFTANQACLNHNVFIDEGSFLVL